MGVEQAAFYNNKTSSSGIVVGSLWTPKKKSKDVPTNPSKLRDRRVMSLPAKYSHIDPIQKTNPLTFGLLGCDF